KRLAAPADLVRRVRAEDPLLPAFTRDVRAASGGPSRDSSTPRWAVVQPQPSRQAKHVFGAHRERQDHARAGASERRRAERRGPAVDGQSLADLIPESLDDVRMRAGLPVVVLLRIIGPLQRVFSPPGLRPIVQAPEHTFVRRFVLLRHWSALIVAAIRRA